MSEKDKDNGDGNVFLIDRHHMGRTTLKDYFIRDQFSEERYHLGHSKVYFWQNRGNTNGTIKVQATTTDSNEDAHKVYEHFKSHLANPGAYVDLDASNPLSRLFRNTEEAKLHYDLAGKELIAATLIRGNIFFHFLSSGEKDHSIAAFLENLGHHWSIVDDSKTDWEAKKLDTDDGTVQFQIKLSKTKLKPGEEALISKILPEGTPKFTSFIYVARPKRLVSLYKNHDTCKLKVKDIAVKSVVSPSVFVIAVLPDGTHVRSNRLSITIVQD